MLVTFRFLPGFCFLMSSAIMIMHTTSDNYIPCLSLFLSVCSAAASVRGVGSTGVDVEELLSGAVVPDTPRTAAAIMAALLKEEQLPPPM